MKQSDLYLMHASICAAPHIPAYIAGWMIAVCIIMSVIWQFLPERR